VDDLGRRKTTSPARVRRADYVLTISRMCSTSRRCGAPVWLPYRKPELYSPKQVHHNTHFISARPDDQRNSMVVNGLDLFSTCPD
jgi:hypothetical protein